MNLWRAFRHDAEVELHYFEFLKLVVRSTLEAFAHGGFLDLALDHVKGRLTAYGVEELSDTLLPRTPRTCVMTRLFRWVAKTRPRF